MKKEIEYLMGKRSYAVSDNTSFASLNVAGSSEPIDVYSSNISVAQYEQDVPPVEEGMISSVGALWPPERASFDRIKGIYTRGVIAEDGMLGEVLQVIRDSEAVFRRGKVTRVSLRAVVDNRFLDEVSKSVDIGKVVEAVVPLAGSQDVFEDASLVYFGLNHRSRLPLPHEIQKYEANLTDAISHPRLALEETTQRALANGYSLGMLEGEPDSKTVDQMTNLYERFGWSRSEVLEILTKKGNIIAVAEKDGVIASSGIAELAKIPIGGNTLRVSEITEAATLESHAKQGLYTAVSSALLKELARRSRKGEILGGEIDLVYGECNGNAPGVLKSAYIQGREFVHTAERSGILFQHVPIVGLPKETIFNDLFPAYMSRSALYSRTQDQLAGLSQLM